MFEINLFNTAQILDQGIAIIGTFLLTSLSAKTRMYGFIAFLLVNIPGVYLLLSLIHISEPTRRVVSRMPSSA